MLPPPPSPPVKARRPDGSEVALKALSLRSLRDWKQLELFQREGSTLAGLTHPAIPRYVDYFEEDDPRDRVFVLVQVGRVGYGCAGVCAVIVCHRGLEGQGLVKSWWEPVSVAMKGRSLVCGGLRRYGYLGDFEGAAAGVRPDGAQQLV